MNVEEANTLRKKFEDTGCDLVKVYKNGNAKATFVAPSDLLLKVGNTFIPLSTYLNSLESKYNLMTKNFEEVMHKNAKLEETINNLLGLKGE